MLKKYYFAICENLGSVWTLGAFETLKEARRAVLDDRRHLTQAEREKQVHYIGTATLEEPDPDYYGDFEEIY